MKKRLLSLLLAFTMAASLFACNSKESTNSSETNHTPEISYDKDSLESILTGIESDFDSTIRYLETKFKETNHAIGNSYQDYIEHKHLLTEWYNLVLKEESALFLRTKEKSIAYLKTIASTIDHDNSDAIDDAMEDFYDEIYDGVMEDFYDEVYDYLLEEAYDLYYDDLVEDGYDLVSYDEWMKESGECYKNWTDTRSAVYKEWVNSRSTLYKYWVTVNNGFYRDDFDVDALINKILIEEDTSHEEDTSNKEDVSNEKDTTKEDSTSQESDTPKGIRPEFKQAMDDYEAFFDEYVDFMNAYLSADSLDMLSLMNEYVEYTNQYSKTMESFQSLDTDDLSYEEALYYAEVSNRISEKLLSLN